MSIITIEGQAGSEWGCKSARRTRGAVVVGQRMSYVWDEVKGGRTSLIQEPTESLQNVGLARQQVLTSSAQATYEAQLLLFYLQKRKDLHSVSTPLSGDVVYYCRTFFVHIRGTIFLKNYRKNVLIRSRPNILYINHIEDKMDKQQVFHCALQWVLSAYNTILELWFIFLFLL